MGFSAQFARDATVAHSGMASARISQSTTSSSGSPAFYLSPLTPIVPDRSYAVSVWMQGSNATGTNQAVVAWFDAARTYIGQSPLPASSTGTFGWQQLAGTVAAPAGAAIAELHLASRGNAGTVWFDDASFADSTPPAPAQARGFLRARAPAVRFRAPDAAAGEPRRLSSTYTPNRRGAPYARRR
jgi:hypothetical protein